MLGLILVYFIGKWFYDLAAKYNRSKWGFAIAGIASYYGGILIGGVIIGISYELVTSQPVDEANETLLGLMALPVGVLMCWGLYRLLQSNWLRDQETRKDNVLDGDLMK